MCEDLKKAIGSFIVKRLEKVEKDLAEQNEKYITLQQEILDFEEQFLKDIPDDKKQLFLGYESRVNSQNNIMLEAAYLQGLKDGIHMMAR